MATVETPPAAAHPGAAVARRVLAVGAVLVLAHLPLLLRHAQQLWYRPHYQFFPLLLLGSVVLAAVRLRGLGPLKPGRAALAYPLLGVAWFGLFAAEMVHSSWLAAVATLLVLLAGAFALGGVALVWRLLPAWVLLWLAVPPPFDLDRNLVLWLQGLTASWSSSLLDLLGIWHVMAGNVVEVAGRRLLVEEACSGVNSLFSVLACTLFFVFVTDRRAIHAVLLLFAALAWVLVANVARVVFVTYATLRWHINLVDGWGHDAVGLGLFALALGLLWSTDRLLLCFFGRPPVSSPAPSPGVGENGTGEASPPEGRFLGAARNTWLASWAVACLYGLVLLAHLTFYGLWAEEPGPDGPVSASLAKLSAVLPARVGDWQRKDFAELVRSPGSAYGEFSKVWTYEQGTIKATLSFDYPFSARHDLRVCYVNQGWALGAQGVYRGAATAREGALAALEVKLTRPGHRCGYLSFCEFDSQGEVLEPLRTNLAMTLTRHGSALQRLWERLSDASPSSRADPVGRIYQFQLFVESYVPLTEAQLGQARSLFLESIRHLRRNWAESGPAPGQARAGNGGIIRAD
jgi:exosortase